MARDTSVLIRPVKKYEGEFRLLESVRDLTGMLQEKYGPASAAMHVAEPWERKDRRAEPINGELVEVPLLVVVVRQQIGDQLLLSTGVVPVGVFRSKISRGWFRGWDHIDDIGPIPGALFIALREACGGMDEGSIMQPGHRLRAWDFGTVGTQHQRLVADGVEDPTRVPWPVYFQDPQGRASFVVRVDREGEISFGDRSCVFTVPKGIRPGFLLDMCAGLWGPGQLKNERGAFGWFQHPEEKKEPVV